jgi:hypothetical protein
MTETGTPSLGRRLLNGWMAIAGRFGFVQTMMLLVFNYAFVIGPFSLGISIFRGDLLAKRGLGLKDTAWQDADSAKPNLERAMLQS